MLIDGSNLLTAMTAERELATLQGASAGAAPPVSVDVLYNPSFSSTTFMIPGLIGIIMTAGRPRADGAGRGTRA